MKTRALLRMAMMACALGGCGGIADLNGDDAGDGGHEGISNDSSTKVPSDDADSAPTTPDGAPTTPDSAPSSADSGFESCPAPTDSRPSICINPTVYRFYPDGTSPYMFRAANEDPNTIDLQDCDDNIALQFNLTISGLPTTDTIEVWAGTTDCSQPSAREAGAGPYCWQVAPPGTFANSQQEYGLIYARNITRFIGVSNPSDELDAVSGVPGSSACADVGPLTSECVTPIDLYFLYMPPGVGSGGTPDAYTVYPQAVSSLPSDGGPCP
jgi:hypothetical protein